MALQMDLHMLLLATEQEVLGVIAAPATEQEVTGQPLQLEDIDRTVCDEVLEF